MFKGTSVSGSGLIMALALAAGFALPAQARSSHDLVVACVQATGVTGEYDYSSNQAVPVVSPLKDGSFSGAGRINACIQANAAQLGLVATPALAAPPRPDDGRAISENQHFRQYQFSLKNEETAPCQYQLTGGSAYRCHAPW